jgi:hypothetical protein
MKDLGMYKTVKQETYHCHFDPDNGRALALGPLPATDKAYDLEAQTEDEALDKLAEQMGKGVLLEPT